MSNEITPTTDGVEEAVEALEEEKNVVEEEEVVETETETETEENDEVEKPTGDTIDSLLQELVANKYELSDELKEKAEKAGINADSLELAGIKDQQRAGEVIQSVYDTVGGEDNFKAMQEWATNGGLSEDEAKEFNDGLVGENRGIFVKGLYAMYKASNPTEQKQTEVETKPKENRVQGKPQQQQSIHKGYKSVRELNEAVTYMRRHPHDRDAERTYNEKMKYSGGLLKR